MDRASPEEQLQRAVAQWLSWVFPEGSGVAWTAFPAGGGGRIRGARLRAMGLHPGWPDLQFVQGGLYYGIELKVRGKYQSAEQKKREGEINRAGAEYAVCRSLEEVSDRLRDWGFPLGSYAETAARRVA